jgi:trehalose 6-phosphate phosphatase
MRFTSPEAMQRYAALARVAARTVVGLDFDGTLAPIVEDPETARIHPRGPGVLLAVASRVQRVAIVTGRPARQVVALGALDEVGTAFADQGLELQVFGQYGNEQWNSHDRRIVGPRPPQGLASFLGELPRILRRCDASDAYIEDKGLAVAVHTRRLANAEAAFQLLLPELAIAAERHGMKVEPGRQVIEVRAPGADKGDVVRKLASRESVGGFCFIGDDLGDLDAFHAVAGLRDEGLPTLLVCSASDEESALVPLSDVVVAGPDGVLTFLAKFAADAGDAAAS